ncbi:MAG: hypothetical protein P8I93_06870 [Crocinitomicaceae bacterium]|nr:hypothetical protein [Crocinitomicaceae bacterium]
MKLILTSLFSVLFVGLTYSQSCVSKYVGNYKIKIEPTIENVKKMSKEKGQEVPEEQVEMMTNMLSNFKLTLNDNEIILSAMGRENKQNFKARTNADGSSCDLVPTIQKEADKEAYLSIIELDKKSIMMKAFGKSGDMDAFVWVKEK